jgi:hypothetical protein
MEEMERGMNRMEKVESYALGKSSLRGIPPYDIFNLWKTFADNL